MALALDGGSVRDWQRFIGEGAWDDGLIRAQHLRMVAESLGQDVGVLIVDGTELPKQGKYSAGVARQWCGIKGKVDNCQAAVFVAYASEREATLLDGQLYLPQEWFEQSSRERWQRCGIPEETPFRTKPALAGEMIESLVSQDVVPFSWVTCDEAFGDNTQFLQRLDQAGLRYFADVSVSTQVWPERPETHIPPAQPTGRPPSRQRLVSHAPAPVPVDELAAQLNDKQWQSYRVKHGEKGPIQAEFAFVRATTVRNKLPGPDIWVVFRRSLSDPAELKIFISNAPAHLPKDELVGISGMCWPIETCFRRAKSQLGMDQYQTRSWRGWHHHMTLVIMAHHFLVRFKLKHKKGRQRLL